MNAPAALRLGATPQRSIYRISPVSVSEPLRPVTRSSLGIDPLPLRTGPGRAPSLAAHWTTTPGRGAICAPSQLYLPHAGAARTSIAAEASDALLLADRCHETWGVHTASCSSQPTAGRSKRAGRPQERPTLPPHFPLRNPLATPTRTACRSSASTPMLAMDHSAGTGMRTSFVKTSTGRRPAPSINRWRLVAAHHLQVDAGNGPGGGSGDG